MHLNAQRIHGTLIPISTHHLQQSSEQCDTQVGPKGTLQFTQASALMQTSIIERWTHRTGRALVRQLPWIIPPKDTDPEGLGWNAYI